ncbi:MAG: 30S ribosomal protein S11 [Deltaproteobacteria bacterium]|nr:30S ribosomal protein S11 [Deltaproteobacteria bacterium]
MNRAPKKKKKRNVPIGVAHIQSTFNNTHVTFTDINGEVICWSSSGSKGFKGSRKSTPFAAQVAAEDCSRKALDAGVKTVAVLVNGPGGGRESAVRAIGASGIKVALIKDVTPIPHNGCRPPKRRRV